MPIPIGSPAGCGCAAAPRVVLGRTHSIAMRAPCVPARLASRRPDSTISIGIGPKDVDVSGRSSYCENGCHPGQPPREGRRRAMRTGRAMNDRRIGRAGFLGVLAAGVGGVFFANDALDRVEEALPRSMRRSQLPSRKWRIYTIGDRIPRLDPPTYRLRITGEVERETTLTLADLRALPAGRARRPTSTASPGGRSTTSTGAASVSTRSSLRPARGRRAVPAVRLGRAGLPRLALARAGAAARRDARAPAWTARRSRPRTGSRRVS